MYADTRTPSMEPQWLAAGLSHVLVSAMIQEELHMFKNHTFHVNDDKEMEELAESIREHGMLIPGIVRPIAEVRH